MLNKIREYEQRQITLSEKLNEQNELIKDIQPFLPRAVERYQDLVNNLPKACTGSNMAILRDKVSTLLGGKVMLTRELMMVVGNAPPEEPIAGSSG